MKRVSFLAVFVCLSAGCVSHSQIMMNPQGEVIRCASWGYGVVGIGMADHNQSICIRDHKLLGYVEIEKVGAIGVGLSKDGLPFIIQVMKNSPAEKAGLVIGDKIMAINGQKVERVDIARPLLFDRPGTALEIQIVREGIEHRFKMIRIPYTEIFGAPSNK